MSLRMTDPEVQEFINRPGFEALSNYSLYDTQAQAVAAWVDKQYFQKAFGTATNGLTDTNMLAAGQMPHPERFLVTSINVRVIPAIGVLADRATAATGETYRVSEAVVRENVILKFSVNGGNEILTAPLSDFPAGNGQVEYASTGNFNYSGFPAVSNAYPFLYPIESKVNFLVELLKPTSTATVTVALRIVVRLNGIRFRSKQR